MAQTKEKNILLLKKLIVSKCIKDPNFKKQFLENPKNALEKEFHMQLPSEMQIKALEEGDQMLYVVLPSQALIESGELKNEFELNDEELKRVTGGGDLISAFIEVAVHGLPITKPGQKGVSGPPDV